MRQRRPNRERLRLFVFSDGAQIVDPWLVGRDALEDALLARGKNDDSKHVVAVDERAQRADAAVQVEPNRWRAA